MEQFCLNFLESWTANRWHTPNSPTTHYTPDTSIQKKGKHIKNPWVLTVVICLLSINNNLNAQSISSATLTDLYLSETKALTNNESINKKNTNYYIDKTIHGSQILIDKINSTATEGSFHLFTHGRPGELLINGEWLNTQKIATFLKQQLSINNYQSSINIYGCNFAKGEKGQQAVACLKETLGISIAASDDITGKDGDWQLEVFTGTIQPQVLTINNWEENLQSCNESTVSGAEALYLFEGNTNDNNNGHNPQNTPNITYPTDKIEGSNSGQYNTEGLRLSNGTFLNSVIMTGRTISMFIKPSDINSAQVLYDEGGNGNGISLAINNGKLQASATEGGVAHTNNISYPFPNDGEWHHVGFTYNAANSAFTLYLDGMPVAYKTVTMNNGTTKLDALAIGNNAGGLMQDFGTAAGGTTGAYTGLMDDVAIYNTVLTPKNMYDIADCEGITSDFPTIACSATGYLVKGTNSVWTTYDFIKGNATVAPADNDNEAHRVNATGYNIIDNRIWGYYKGPTWNYSGGELTITGYDENTSEFVTVVTPPIDGLPTNNNGYVAGDVSNGILYLYYAGADEIHKVGIDPASTDYMTYLGATPTFTNTNVDFSDFAFHSDDLIFSIVNENASALPGHLVSIKPSTGAITDHGLFRVAADNDSATEFFGGTFIDGDGYMYVLSNETGNVYRLDLTNPPSGDYDEEANTTLFLSSVTSGSNDGAMCLDAVVALDFGDAPESYGTSFETGPRHGVLGYNTSNPTVSLLMLGTNIDREGDGAPSSLADSDNYDDGITWPDSLIPGTTYNETITVTNTTGEEAYLNVWIDYNRDGDFLDAGEQLFTDQIIASEATAVSVPLSFTVPLTASEGNTYTRIRLCDAVGDCDDPSDIASAGEIEDYRVKIAGIADLELTKTVDEDEPSVGSTVTFTVTVTNNGPSNATGVTVKDLIPSELIYVSNTVSSGSYNETTGIWDFSSAILDVDDTEVMTITVTIGPNCDTISSTAEIMTSSRPDPDSTPGNGD